MKTLSWVLLAVVGTLTLVLSLVSAGVAYRGDQDQIGPIKQTELAAGRQDVLTALKARRATAAAYAAGFAALFLAVVVGPYRRGDVWAFWALLVATLVYGSVSLLRIPLLGTNLGAGAAGIQLGIVVVALLLDARRLKAV